MEDTETTHQRRRISWIELSSSLNISERNGFLCQLHHLRVEKPFSDRRKSDRRQWGESNFAQLLCVQGFALLLKGLPGQYTFACNNNHIDHVRQSVGKSVIVEPGPQLFLKTIFSNDNESS